MDQESQLKVSQRLLADAQRYQISKSWWTDGKEVLKLTASVVALLAATWAGFLEIREGALTAKVRQLQDSINEHEERLESTKTRMEFFYAAVPFLKAVPEELIEVLDNISQTQELEKWEKEALSDAHILSATYDAVCGNYKESDYNMELAEKFDTNETNFNGINQLITKMKLLPLTEGIEIDCYPKRNTSELIEIDQ